MVKYERETIMFYALVENSSRKNCIVIEEAFQFFKQFGLDTVSVSSVGVYQTYDQLCDGVYKLFKDVSKAKISEDEEGSVLYFVKRTNPAAKENSDEVLSLCKLKTLEYRIFRKMREKLRNGFSVKCNKKFLVIFKDFKSEVNQLAFEHELPQPVEFYFDLFEYAYKYCETFPNKVDLLNEEYITFVEEVISS